jgi:4-hydroxy-tetrahydrodipicolinate synthase
MSYGERRELVEKCAEIVGSRAVVVPQTGALTTADAVSLTRHAEQCGAAAVLAMPPYFAPLSGTALRRYLAALVDAVSIPVILYHNPAVTGLHASPTQLVELCDAVGIRHVKYTSPDVSGLVELLTEHADAVQTLPAWDHLVLTAFATGARASIWGAAAAVPELCVELLHAAGDGSRLVEVWRRAAPVFTGFATLGYIPAVKAAMTLLGTPAGPPRAPLEPLAAPDVQRLAGLLSAAGCDPARV